MESHKRRRLAARLNSLVFHLLLATAVGLAGWLSTRHELQWDWTKGGRNTLSETSQQILARLDAPLRITCFAPENPLLRQRVQDVVKRYQRHKSDTELVFINPETHPEQARQLGITLSGELLLEYKGRSETLQQITEQDLSNVLQRLAQTDERWIVHINGHGERSLEGQANFDLGNFGRELKNKGFQVQALNLTATPTLPNNTGLLVIASPRVDYLPGELTAIQQYLEAGGNLLWLTDPDSPPTLGTLAQTLGISFLPGVIVDTNAGALNIDDPAVALVPEYSQHPATRDFKLLTLYPYAAALQAVDRQGWQASPLLTTLPRTWNETGALRGEIAPDTEHEQTGPLHIGMAFTRDLEQEEGRRQQRVIVVGDGDFLSNAVLGNGGNLDLGLNLVRWLAGADTMLNISAKTAPDLNLKLSRTQSAVIGLGFLFGLPLILFSAGLLIWWRRRKR